MPLNKRDALAYMVRRAKPITAKELAIDLDSRASTASELLERMTAQSLCSRDPKQRPREYSLTDTGRERLAFFQSQDGRSLQQSSVSQPNSDWDGDKPDGSNSSTSDSVRASEPPEQQVDGWSKEVCQRLDGVRQDLHDLMEALVPSASSERERPNLADRVRSLIERADALANGLEDGMGGARIRELYNARRKLASLGLFESKGAVKKQIGDLEAELGPETAQAVARLVQLEEDAEFWGPSNEEAKDIAQLRQQLGLPAGAVESKAGAR